MVMVRQFDFSGSQLYILISFIERIPGPSISFTFLSQNLSDFFFFFFKKQHHPEHLSGLVRRILYQFIGPN